jgi:hypothetical protein
MRLRISKLMQRIFGRRRLRLAGAGRGGPVFVFSVHRSGGTLLMRLLNCHEKLVIWGEHAGILNRLAEMAEVVAVHKSLNPLDDDGRELKRFVRNEGKTVAEFSPWAGPLDDASFLRAARGFAEEIFSRGLAPGQRWGFKEIRYYRPELAAFLLELFPDARFILLQRDLVELAVSNILAPWSLAFIHERHPVLDEPTACKIIEDVLYGLIAFQHGFDVIARKFPRRVLRLDYATLRDDGAEAMRAVLKFLRLEETAELLVAWRRTMALRLGDTDKTASGPLLAAGFIEQHARAALPALQAEFAAVGAAPLLAQGPRRQRPYAAILGDHTAREGDYPTLF